MEHRMGCTMSDAENGNDNPVKNGADIQGTPPEIPVSEIKEPDEQQKAYADLNDRFLRLAADFDNYKKRSERDRALVVALANERFAVDILEVVDNINRALKADDAHLREGVIQIQQLLDAQLQRNSVCPIESLKKPFNPAEHEAIVHLPSDEKIGTVIDEVSRGYRMHEKVIRYAKVAVSKGNQKNKEV